MKSSKDWMAIKLNMNETYDRVEWPFLIQVLMAFGFAKKSINLIITRVTTMSYRI